MKKLIILIVIIFSTAKIIAQNVGIGTTVPSASAMLDVNSTTKGALVPRMTTAQKNAIVSPAAGLIVFDTEEKTLFMFDGQQWLGFSPLTNFQRPATNFVYGPDNLQDTTLTGYSVSMWDQFVAVGAPYKKTGNITTGGVYIYKLVGGNWQFFVTLNPSGNNFQSNFGLSVSLKGNYLIVGAPYQKNAGNVQVGAAYTYNFNGTNWQQTQVIYGSVANTNYGTTVAINQFGTYIAVSETGAQVGALTNCGVVRVYNKPASTFVLQQSIQDLNPVAGENFGTTLAMSPLGVHIIVGAPGKTVNGFFNNGYVGQFDRNGPLWTQTHTYTPISEDALGIGTNVDISDGHVTFTTAKKREINYFNLSWSGYTTTFTDEIHSISIDPVTDYFNVFSGNSLYYSLGGSNTTKYKTLSADYIYTLPNLLSVYNASFITGIPTTQNFDKPYVGAIYFGLFQ